MKANTAVALVLCGIALGLLTARRSVWLERSVRALAGLIAVLGLATLGEYAFDWPLGIDEWMFRDTANAYNAIPGRMSPYTATAFVAIGVAVGATRWPALKWLTSAAALLVATIGSVSVIGYLWNASELVTDHWLPPVAVNTGCAFILLGIGTLASHRDPTAQPAGPRARLAAVEIKILAGFILATSLLLLGGGYTYRASVEFADSIESIVHTQTVRAKLADVRNTLLDIESAYADYLLTADAARREKFVRLTADADKQLAELARLIADNPVQQENLAELRPMVAVRIEVLARGLAVHDEQSASAAQPPVLGSGRLNNARPSQAWIDRMDDAEAQLLLARRAASTRMRQTTLISLLITLALATCVFVLLFRGIRREMLARAQAEQALRASDQYNRGIVESSPDCLALLTLDARLSEMTPQGQRLMDVQDFGAIENADWLAFWRGADHEAARRAVDAARAGHPGRFAGECRTLAGTPKWWDVIVMPILGRDGAPQRLLAVARDMTEVKRTEEAIRHLNSELQHQATQLESTNKELESFSYSVSHDLRAPLRAIDGFARMLEDNCADRLDAEGHRYLGVIRTNTRRMDALIDDLLAFSQLGRQPLAKAEVNMQALVQEVIEEALAARDLQTPRIDVAPLPPAQADRTLLRQVWVNLFSNALKYGSTAAHPTIEIHGCRDGDENVYSIRDNGAGFSMQYYDKLFGVFQRLHRADEFNGTGVGLAIVHRIVTRHGGRVWANGEINAGAEFSFSLPHG